MKYRLATACFVIGATLAPVAFAEDTDADRANFGYLRQGFGHHDEDQDKLAAEHMASLKDIKVDTDNNGVSMSCTVKAKRGRPCASRSRAIPRRSRSRPT
jgi:hypothetical protein